MKRKNIVEKVLELPEYGNSPKKLADAIGRGLKRQNVERWRQSGQFPVRYCAAVHELTGISLYELNDIAWKEIEEALK